MYFSNRHVLVLVFYLFLEIIQVGDALDFFSIVSIYCILTIKFCCSLWKDVYFKWSGTLLILIIYLRAPWTKKCTLKILKLPTSPHCLFPLLIAVSLR